MLKRIKSVILLNAALAFIIAFNANAAEADMEIYLPLVMNTVGEETCRPATLIKPANNSSLSTLAPFFQWDRGTNSLATKLVLQVANNDSFSPLRHTYTTTSLFWRDEYRFPWNLDQGANYFWRTYVECGSSDRIYSQVWSFTTPSGGSVLPAPSLLSPTDGSTIAGTSTMLEWTPMSSANEYLVRWSKEGSTSVRNTWTSDSHYSIAGLNSGSVYKWWVSAVSDYGVGGNSDSWSFSTP